MGNEEPEGSFNDQILAAFFAAMREGYAADCPKEDTISGLPGSTVISFPTRHFTVKDCYFVAREPCWSFGQTVIWSLDKPVWVMSYQGWYEKSAISFLKFALFQNYSANVFVGGRGPSFCHSPGWEKLFYVNTVEPPNDWKHFKGKEKIFECRDNETRLLGWHEYHGLLLRDPE